MKRNRLSLTFALACGVLLVCSGKLMAADSPAKVAGNWEMTREGHHGNRTRTLTLQQEGSEIKGTLKWESEQVPVEGSVTGNDIRLTARRDTPNGPLIFEYSGTVDGDSMQGAFHSARSNGVWSAKRSGSKSEK